MLDIVAALQASFPEVHYMDFYRAVFPVGFFEERWSCWAGVSVLQ